MSFQIFKMPDFIFARMKLKAVVLFFFLFSFSVYAQEQVQQAEAPSAEEQTLQKSYFEQIFGFPFSDAFNPSWYESIYHWLGTPYRYAGKNLKGIDCSNFVNEVYKSVMGFMAGTNSAEQYARSQRINKEELKEGDLVFFKINRKRISHVGIYLGNDRFAHSSRSKGVIISDLKHPYYKTRFAGAGRLVF
jgi:lipoprotein Spr